MEEQTLGGKNFLFVLISIGMRQQAIPLLRRGTSATVTMSQYQASCLLANAFLCTFPTLLLLTNPSNHVRFPEINFYRFFEYNRICFQKLRCIFHYFERVLVKKPSGVISFSRQAVTDIPRWARSDKRLRALHVTSRETIEDYGVGFAQVDFANACIGGGVLDLGCVQEEIRFLICPELIVSRLFTECLQENECLIISGFERFSYYAGYANTFKWLAPYYDDTPRDKFHRRAVELIAIDAKYYRRFQDQFKPKWILRDLNKAYAGFFLNSETVPAVVTGNWGCGVYHGCCQLKSNL
ncbi:unnamed protein product [Soboliphyme baturini]|uniref:poly(ADP-ribose) glycohydrolase n=1 Tax=Soboliphyme baturini TaxID=241478 RepID=A0A183IZY5_9BILA|nr:unnamed protein product [Soboliphyme baturini]